jgi:hypothetical protein
MQLTIDQQIDFITEKLEKASRAIEGLSAVVPVTCPPPVTVMGNRQTNPLPIVEILRARQNILAARRATGSNGIAVSAVAGK